MSKARCISSRRMGCCALLLGGAGGPNNSLCHALLASTRPQHRLGPLHPHPPSAPLQLMPPSSRSFAVQSTPTLLHAKPKRGSVVDSYQTVAVNCSSCRSRLFRYKKKNGTKSNLIKCFVERTVCDDPDGVLERQLDNFAELAEEEGGDHQWCCPNCGAKFGRSATIRGLPAIKLAGGKTRMTKK